MLKRKTKKVTKKVVVKKRKTTKKKPRSLAGTLNPTVVKEISSLMQKIKTELIRVNKKVAPYKKVKNPHWGHVGDLGRILTILQEI